MLGAESSYIRFARIRMIWKSEEPARRSSKTQSRPAVQELDSIQFRRFRHGKLFGSAFHCSTMLHSRALLFISLCYELLVILDRIGRAESRRQDAGATIARAARLIREPSEGGKMRVRHGCDYSMRNKCLAHLLFVALVVVGATTRIAIAQEAKLSSAQQQQMESVISKEAVGD
jgi:hypothetical protein